MFACHILGSHHNIDLRHPNFDQDHFDQGLFIRLHLMQPFYGSIDRIKGMKRFSESISRSLLAHLCCQLASTLHLQVRSQQNLAQLEHLALSF
jgi:hypothetical protein